MMPSSIVRASENGRPFLPVGRGSIPSINDHWASDSNWNRDTIPNSQPDPELFIRHALAGLQPVDARDTDDGLAGLVGGGQVDRRRDAPVVIAGRIVQNLPDGPLRGAVLDEQQCGTAGIRSREDLVVLSVI